MTSKKHLKPLSLGQALGMGLALTTPVAFAAPEVGSASGDTTCTNGKGTPYCGPCEEDCTEGGSTYTGSFVSNGDYDYHMSSNDFSFNDAASSCGSCGATPLGGTGSLPTLDINRYTRVRSHDNAGSFGLRSGFENYDRSLWLRRNKSFLKRQDVGTSEKLGQMHYDASRQAWVDLQAVGKHVFGVFLYDASGVLITSGTNRDQAQSAILMHHDGSSEHYEIIWKSNGEGHGRLVTLMDRNGNATTIDYAVAQPLGAVADLEQYKRKSTITDAYGRSAQITTIEQAGQWVISRIDFPNGEHATYEYADMGDLGNPVLSKVNHPNGGQTTWTVGALAGPNLLELSVVEPNARPGSRQKKLYFTQKTGFDYAGNAVTTVPRKLRYSKNGEGEATFTYRLGTDSVFQRFSYVGGNKYMHLEISEAAHGITKYGFLKPDAGRDSHFFTATDTTAWAKENVRTQVNASSRYATAMTDGLGRGKAVTRNPITQQVVGRVLADGSTNSVTHNTFAMPLSSVDRLGRSSVHSYDLQGNRLTSTRGVGSAEESTKSYVYNSRGQLIEERDALYDANKPELHNTQYVYNAAGYLIKKIAAADVEGGTRPESVYSYDSFGRVVSTTDPVGRTVSYEYDVMSRVVKTTYNDGSTELVHYQAGTDLVTSRTDRNGILTSYTYDLADRAIETRLAAGTPEESLEQCTYLEGTRQKETCTINGEKTTYLFDHRNRVVGTTRQVNADTALSTSTEYDQLSRRRSSTDAYGRKTYFLYDQNDRITRTVTETVPNGLTNVPAIVENASQSATAHSYSLTDKDGNSLVTAGTHQVTYTCPRDLFLKNLVRDNTITNHKYLITDVIFDAEGQRLLQTDARGNKTWMEYDQLGRNTLTVRAVGTPEEIRSETDYDDNSNVIEQRLPRYFAESVDDGNGGQTNLRAVETYTYNGRNMKASHTTAAGSEVEATQSWTYLLDGKLDKHTDFRGNILQQLWHACCGRLQATIDRDGTSTTISNTDYNGNVTHTATVSAVPNSADYHNPVNAETLQETTTRYDGRGRPTYTTRWLTPLGEVIDHARENLNQQNGTNDTLVPIAGLDGVSASSGLTTSYLYDEDLTDGVGIDASYAAQFTELTNRGTTLGAGANGFAVEVTNPAGEKSVRVTDGAGRTILSINPEGDIQTVHYDEVVTEASLNTQNSTLSIPGDLLATTQTDALGNSNTSYTDGVGRSIASEDAIGSFSFRAYDANSNLVSTRDPNGLGQDCTFDALNRDVTCADLQEQADGVDRYKLYNAASQVISSADAQGNVTTQSYDARNRLVSTTDPNQIVVDYTYDANSNLTSLNDGNGNTRTWEYNARNLKSRKTNPTPNDVLDYAYDALRRLTLKIDQDNHHHISEYDMASRLEKRVYKTGGTITESEDSFTYDAASRLLTSSKGRYSVTTAHTYAADSSPLSESISYQGKTYTTARTYDAANRPISQTFQDGKVQTWVYDARNLVASSSYEGESVFTQIHDDGYRLTHQTLGNGLTHSITYGRSDHLRTFDFVLDGTQSIEDLELSYSYAVDKQITAETVTGGVMQDASFTASYDDGNRVTAWNRTGAIDTNSPETQSWNYDDAGNWTSTTIDGTVQNRSHNDDNELTAVAGNNTAFDDRGNLTEDDQGNVYIYDLDNRLKRVELDNNTDVDMVYDALGRRVLIDNGTDETFYTWWGDQEVAEHEHNSTQSTVQNDLWAHPTALNTIIARAVEGSKFKMEWYHKNYLDHVYAVSDDSGDILEHYRYNAFGEVEIYNTSGNELATSAIDNKVTWNSRRYDSDTKLHYYKYRHYNPTLGRWLSRDPIEEAGGINLYGFVGNDPVGRWDELGLKCKEYIQYEIAPSGHDGIKDFDEQYENVIIGRITVCFELDSSSCKGETIDDCTGDVSGKITFKWVNEHDSTMSRGGKGKGKNPYKGDPYNGKAKVPGMKHHGSAVGKHPNYIPIAVKGSSEILWNGKHDENGNRIGKGSSFEGELSTGSVPCVGGWFNGTVKVGTNMASDPMYHIKYGVVVECCGEVKDEKISLQTAPDFDKKLVEVK
ncbi:RHS repeat-associated core domain-containing protein [Rubritalea tangerina]|uniref:RHS repeat-associated core domain-containing protein n=1 Tax=Rubritalea tangerina TaxID=430798 RepID=UPI00361D4E39